MNEYMWNSNKIDACKPIKKHYLRLQYLLPKWNNKIVLFTDVDEQKEIIGFLTHIELVKWKGKDWIRFQLDRLKGDHFNKNPEFHIFTLIINTLEITEKAIEDKECFRFLLLGTKSEWIEKMKSNNHQELRKVFKTKAKFLVNELLFNYYQADKQIIMKNCFTTHSHGDGSYSTIKEEFFENKIIWHIQRTRYDRDKVYEEKFDEKIKGKRYEFTYTPERTRNKQFFLFESGLEIEFYVMRNTL
jgi:hypothetical protein